jgi:SAM-dependent methyltransferase
VVVPWKRKLRTLLNVPSGSEIERLDSRTSSVEQALLREVDALRQRNDESAFAMAKLAAGDVARSLSAEMELRLRSAREHTEAASDAAVQAAVEHADAAIAAAVATSREHTEAASDAAVRAAVGHADAADKLAREHITNEIAGLRREVARLGRSATRRNKQQSPRDEQETSSLDLEQRSEQESIDEALYLAIEDRFRGDPAFVRERQKRYLATVEAAVDADRPLLDLGCGRGEWLGLLADAEIPARGIDSNATCVGECIAAGLDASYDDLVGFLAASEDDSVGAITMFHVVEHLPFATLDHVLAECARVLAPGGVLVAETPNALNLRVAATTFWLDPTHVRPLHPMLLRLLGERAGFARIEDIFLNDYGSLPEFNLGDEALSRWLTELGWTLDGPADYAMLAWVPTAADD